MLKHYFFILFVPMLFLFGREPSFDQGVTQSDISWFDVSFYNGYVQGESQEMVFSRTESGKIYKRSQLDWDIGNLWVIGTRISANSLQDRFHLSFDGWSKAAVSKEVMQDRDWGEEDAFQFPTYISWTSSHLKTAYKMVGEMSFDSPLFIRNHFGVKYSALGGYEYFKFFWTGKGGYYSYNNGEDTGSFENTLLISYDQIFSIPYWGVQMDTNWREKIKALAYLKLSGGAMVWERDIHYLREVSFDEKFHKCDYWMVGGAISWNIWKYLDCHMKYDYQQLNTAFGTMIVHEKEEPDQVYGSAGLFHRHQTISLGMSARF